MSSTKQQEQSSVDQTQPSESETPKSTTKTSTTDRVVDSEYNFNLCMLLTHYHLTEIFISIFTHRDWMMPQLRIFFASRSTTRRAASTFLSSTLPPLWQPHHHPPLSLFLYLIIHRTFSCLALTCLDN